jgi:hypothetical protein
MADWVGSSVAPYQLDAEIFQWLILNLSVLLNQ